MDYERRGQLERPHDEFLKRFLVAQRALRSYFQIATRDPHETDDLLQQVSPVLWERFNEYDRGRPFLPWAIGFARVQVLRWKQQRARLGDRLLSDGALGRLADAAADSGEEPDDRSAFLAACLDGLSADARHLLELRYNTELPIRQIADRLGRQVGAVEMALVRARRSVRECVERKLKKAGE